MGSCLGDRDSVSLILPVLDESREVRRFLGALRRDPPAELIVVDGGSTDGTVSIVQRAVSGWAARVVCTAETSGLSGQLNHGAARARGDILFFPYVDCRLPEGWSASIRHAFSDPHVVGGAFRLGFDDDRWLFRAVARAANLRTALGIGPFGDQGIFVRREIFEACGGFRDDRLLEDLDFIHRVRGFGRVQVIDRVLRSSTRRWRQSGFVRTSLENWLYLARHLTGCGRGHRDRYRQYRVASH